MLSILTILTLSMDPMMYALQKSTHLPGIAVDVGANGGGQTNMALKMDRKVLAVECLASAYSFLLTMFEKNENVTLVHICAGSETGLNILNLADDSSSIFKSNIQHGAEYKKAMRLHNINAHNRQHVVTVRLDDIVSEPVAVLKIDTQGFEYNVLLGAQSILKKYRPVVMFEHDSNFQKNGNPLTFFQDNYNCKRMGGDYVCVPT